MIDVDEAEKAAHHKALLGAVEYATRCRAQPLNGEYQQAALDDCHAAIRALRSAAFEAGLEAAAVEAHHYLKHKAVAYEVRPERDLPAAIRSLAAKESSDGD